MYAHVELQNGTFFRKRVFADVIKIKSHWMSVGPKPNDWGPYEKRGGQQRRRPCADGGRGGRTPPQAKDRRGLPATTRAEEEGARSEPPDGTKPAHT